MRAPDHSADFAQLALPLLEPLYNFAHWLTQSRDEAEDLVQETFAKALKGFGSFQAGTNFRAWMFRILRNTFLTSRTGLKTMVTLDDAEDAQLLPAVGQTPETFALGREDQELVRAAIEQLPIQYREAVLLCDLEGMSYTDIAGVLGIPVGTVMSRIARARRAMRQFLASAWESPGMRRKER